LPFNDNARQMFDFFSGTFHHYINSTNMRINCNALMKIFLTVPLLCISLKFSPDKKSNICRALSLKAKID